jgi:hypothetical protein
MLLGVIVYMMDGVVVGDGLGIKCSVITTGTPTIVVLGHDVLSGRSGTLRATSFAVL